MPRYSLADYEVTFAFNNSALQSAFGNLRLGGQGSTTESINVTKDKALYEVAGYETGGYVFNKNCDKSGNVEITLNILDANTVRLSNLYKYFEENDPYGNNICTITVKNARTSGAGSTVAKCSDCYPSNQPPRQLSGTAQTMTWSFACGKIDFDM